MTKRLVEFGTTGKLQCWQLGLKKYRLFFYNSAERGKIVCSSVFFIIFAASLKKWKCDVNPISPGLCENLTLTWKLMVKLGRVSVGGLNITLKSKKFHPSSWRRLRSILRPHMSQRKQRADYSILTLNIGSMNWLFRCFMTIHYSFVESSMWLYFLSGFLQPGYLEGHSIHACWSHIFVNDSNFELRIRYA